MDKRQLLWLHTGALVQHCSLLSWNLCNNQIVSIVLKVERRQLHNVNSFFFFFLDICFAKILVWFHIFLECRWASSCLFSGLVCLYPQTMNFFGSARKGRAVAHKKTAILMWFIIAAVDKKVTRFKYSCLRAFM